MTTDISRAVEELRRQIQKETMDLQQKEQVFLNAKNGLAQKKLDATRAAEEVKKMEADIKKLEPEVVKLRQAKERHGMELLNLQRELQKVGVMKK